MSLKILYGILGLFLITGCATHRQNANMPEPRVLGKNLPAYPVQPTDSVDELTDIKVPEDSLTLANALSVALLHNPALAIFSYEIRAAEARTLQAGLYPNPELEFELEEFAGGRELSGLGGSEISGALSQTILLGGKRYKNMKAAALESDLIGWDYESARLNVLTEVRQTFVEVLAAQERVKLNEELLQLSERLLQTILQRVEAGKISPAEASRERVTLAATQIELERSRRDLNNARQRLAAVAGSKQAFFNSVTGILDTLYAIPPYGKLAELLVQNPDLARFETALKQRQASIAVEDARRVPDPTVRGGMKYLNEIDDYAFIMGLSMPLPISNRNQGARRQARYRLMQTQKQKQATEISLNAALTQTYQNLQSTEIEVNSLRNRILPEAENAYEVINEGYLQGRFGFIDVLDAQRTLFEARGQYLRALSEFHGAVAEIERLIAQDINSVK